MKSNRQLLIQQINYRNEFRTSAISAAAGNRARTLRKFDYYF